MWWNISIEIHTRTFFFTICRLIRIPARIKICVNSLHTYQKWRLCKNKTIWGKFAKQTICIKIKIPRKIFQIFNCEHFMWKLKEVLKCWGKKLNWNRIFIWLRKASRKNFSYCRFWGQLVIFKKKKKVVSTPLVLLHLLRRSENVALALACQAIPRQVEQSFSMGVQSLMLLQLCRNLLVTYADHPKILGTDPLSRFCRLNHIPASTESSSSSCRQYKLAVLIIWSSPSVFPDVKDFFILLVK